MATVSPKLQKLIDDGLFGRLPPTFATYSFDRINDWNKLFPAERDYFERLFGMLARSEDAAVERLFAPLFAVEEKMGVRRGTWNTKEFTLEHVDFLERNRHLAEWREIVAGIFAEIDPLLDAEVARQGRPRLVFVVSPSQLPMGPDRMWQRLKDKGKLVDLDLGDADDPIPDYLAKLFSGAPRAGRASTIFGMQGQRADNPFDSWIVEAGDRIHPLMQEFSGWTGLSFDRLAELRQILMNEVNDLVQGEQIPGPRQLGERLQKMNPGALNRAAGRDAVLRDFLQSVLLNGNGTLLVNNTFVEWASVQAIRRAKPSLIGVSFGIRNKIKPFSSLLIYSDQEETNPIPTQEDVLGSYVDLEIFYEYIYNECEKYIEYRRNTGYIFVGEGMDKLLAIGPADFPLLQGDNPRRLEDVFEQARQWLGR